MKRLIGIMALIGLMAGCSEDPAQGAAEICKREVESRSKNDQGSADVAELIESAAPGQP